MSSAIAVRDEITEAKITEYLDALGSTTSLLPAEKKMFINIAKEFGLNPFKKELHVTAYGEGKWRKCSIITGYEVYIKRAERTGKLNGYDIKIVEDGDSLKTMKAVVTIYRKDWDHPFVHEAFYIESVQYNKDGEPNAVWAKQPRFMTKKVAIGQAFRLCFSDDLGGMPYEESEVPQHERDVTEPENIAPEAEKPESPPPGGRQRTPEEAEIDSLTADIGRILKEEDPDGLGYFPKGEVDANRELCRNARKAMDPGAIKKLHVFLLRELAKRKAECKPVPFAEEEFRNDIPDGMYPPSDDLF